MILWMESKKAGHPSGKKETREAKKGIRNANTMGCGHASVRRTSPRALGHPSRHHHRHRLHLRHHHLLQIKIRSRISPRRR
jgi:hypothetical protein